MLNLKHPVSRWEQLQIECNAIETTADRPESAEAVLEHYDHNFHLVFNSLKARHPGLCQITIEGLRLKPLEEFYGLDIVLHIFGRCLYLSLDEVANAFGTAGIPYLR